MKIKLDEGAFMPERAHANDAGLDLFSPIRCMVPARGSVSIDTGVHVELPHRAVGLLTSKSGLMKKCEITCRGTIDEGYIGSIHAILFNAGKTDVLIERGDKIAQLVILPCLVPTLRVVEKLDDTERGEKGFGSTGSKSKEV